MRGPTRFGWPATSLTYRFGSTNYYSTPTRLLADALSKSSRSRAGFPGLLHWLVSPASRLFRAACRPVAWLLGVFLFLPPGLRPLPGLNDHCPKDVLLVARTNRPWLRTTDFADGLRLAEKGGSRDRLSASLTRFMALLSSSGIRYHTKEGKRWRPCQSTPRVGSVVTARDMEAQIDLANRKEGMSLRGAGGSRRPPPRCRPARFHPLRPSSTSHSGSRRAGSVTFAADGTA